MKSEQREDTTASKNGKGQYQIRAHHGMCFAFFEGKGYSDSFIRHMGEMKKVLEENPLICLVEGTDDVCGYCPNNQGGICHQQEKVIEYDRQVLKMCGLPSGTVLSWRDFSDRVQKKIIGAGKRTEICGNCQWNGICLTKNNSKL